MGLYMMANAAELAALYERDLRLLVGDRRHYQ